MSVYDAPVTSATGTSPNVMATAANVPSDRGSEKSLGDLFADLTRETSQLVRQEVQLAKAEMTAKAVKIGKDVAMIAVGGMLAYAGLLLVLIAIAYGLIALGMAHWAAALLVGVVVLAISGLLVWQGLAGLKRVDPVPHETVQTLKEDKEWLQGKH